MKVKRIGVMTSGGDAPGMNAAIRSVVRTAAASGVEVVGVKGGYRGLLTSNVVPLGVRDVGGILTRGGTMLGSGRVPEFKEPGAPDQAIANARTMAIDGLVAIGGDGTQAGGLALHTLGFPVVGVASTIDNDLAGFDMSIGVDTALNTAMSMVDRLRDTASSHHRAFIVEVMGRHSGYLALMVGLACGAEITLVPESPYTTGDVENALRAAYAAGKSHFVCVAAEGSPLKAADLAADLKSRDPAFEIRLSVLGHVQRGGGPTIFDRLLGTRSAAVATQALLAGQSGVVAGLVRGRYDFVPSASAVRDVSKVPADLLDLAVTLAL
ncbi:MAG: ATP-dependent 6-phosphofructokinase [Chloroflexota bacterium]|nr:ATP-dependent 6-phosphofructokinase [Chloroflexota bacterium]